MLKKKIMILFLITKIHELETIVNELKKLLK